VAKHVITLNGMWEYNTPKGPLEVLKNVELISSSICFRVLGARSVWQDEARAELQNWSGAIPYMST
jgi:hypothetical protein